ncbi:MAG: Rpn family recombination-promoting nuclease/putative transposase [Saprospiraceae bacterium]|nr:Rpn family recombination-promoting nuclease/putative transposase [Saprospiraceae bacterium]MDW8483397.1 Rpn family recombination-promoting nuclease/putative transposase [Saprospiraceae bacterium]
MAKRNIHLHLNPSDHYIKEVLKVEAIARSFVETFLPSKQLACLKISTLQLASDSFIGEDLRQYFSDIVYTCQTDQDEPMRICILIEHKSTPVGRRIYVQLGNYLRNIQEEDIRQRRKYFTLTIPILIQQTGGEPALHHLVDYYGPVPAEMLEYIPSFKIITINIQALTDEFIEGLGTSLLLRNILLVLKHARDADYMRVHFSKVLTFVSEDVDTEILLILFRATFIYVQQVTNLSKEEIMDLIQTLPSPYEQEAKTTYEQILEEGFEKGLEKGWAKSRAEGITLGLEKAIFPFLGKNSSWRDEEAATFEVSIENALT